MGISANPANRGQLVETFVNTAYDKVKTVHDNLAEILRVADISGSRQAGTVLPTTRKDGSALLGGDTFFHEDTNILYNWNSVTTEWVPSGFVNVTKLPITVDSAIAASGTVDVSSTPYTVGGNNLTVYINGVHQSDYTETDPNTIDFGANTLEVGDKILVIVSELISEVGLTTADQVNFTPAGTGAILTDVQNKLRQDVSLLDFIPVAEHAAIKAGTSTTDVSSYIQAAIDALTAGGRIFVPRGVYKISAQVNLDSNIAFVGEGKNVSIFIFDSAFGTTGNMFNGSGVTNISFEHIGFNGNDVGSGGSQTRFAAMIVIAASSSNITMSNCKVYGHKYIGLSIGNGCDNVLISGNEFTDLGYEGTTVNGGVCLWISGTAGASPTNVRVVNNHFHDNFWSGMQANLDGGLISQNTFENNKEAHIFSSNDLVSSNYTSRNTVISNNIFKTVTINDISSHGIEGTWYNSVISDNYISDCDHGGIALNGCQNMVVKGNVIGNFNKGTTSWGGISISNNFSSPNNSKKISIYGNTFFDNQSPQTASYGVRSVGSGDPMEYVEIYDNDFEDITFVTALWGIQNSNWDFATCRRRNNKGSDDVGPYYGVLNITTTGALSATGFPFPPKRLEMWSYVSGAAYLVNSYSRVEHNSTGTLNIINMNESADGTTGRQASSSTDVVVLRQPDSTAVTTATFTSLNVAGFTINVTAHAGGTSTIKYAAYP